MKFRYLLIIAKKSSKWASWGPFWLHSGREAKQAPNGPPGVHVGYILSLGPNMFQMDLLGSILDTFWSRDQKELQMGLLTRPSVVISNATLYCATQCTAMLCYAMLCYAMLCSINSIQQFNSIHALQFQCQTNAIQCYSPD